MWFIAILLLGLLHSCTCELLLVQEVFRHGARYPIYPSQVDGSQYALIQGRVGELTTEGKRMHYLLGQQLYKEYWHDLGFNGVFNSSKIYVKSTNINRTVESVQSQLVGWLEKSEALVILANQTIYSLPAWSNGTVVSPSGNVYLNSPAYQSVPIHTELGGSNPLNPGDFLYYFTYDNCPNMRVWEQENKQNSELQTKILETPRVQQALAAVKAALKLNSVPTLDQIEQYVDNFYCMKNAGRTVNPVFDDNAEYRAELDLMRIESLYINLFSTDLQINTTITPFMLQTRKNMRAIINDRNRQRLFLYSAHDLTVANVLVGFRLTSAQCVYDSYVKGQSVPGCVSEYPRFASNLIFELHYINNTYKVRTRYGGRYLDMGFCTGGSSSKQCSYDSFEKFINQTVRLNYMEDCGVIKDLSPQFPLGLTIGTSIVGALFLGSGVFLALLYKKKQKLSAYNQQTDENPQ